MQTNTLHRKVLTVEDVHIGKIVMIINADDYHLYRVVRYDPFPIESRVDLDFILDVIEMDKGHVVEL